MRRFKILSVLIMAILALAYVEMIGFKPSELRKNFKYPHFALGTKVDLREIGSMDFRAFDKDGRLLWEELDRKNNLADEGEYLFLDVTLRQASQPTNYFLRLFNDTPTETDTLGDLTGEPTQNGYAAQTVEANATGWPTLALDSGDYQATSSTETFSASGGSWGPVTYCVLATSTDGSGKLVSYVALSQSRTLNSGESLQVTYKLKLQ
jgi:hypothetical protein